jgi:hypothetical protein
MAELVQHDPIGAVADINIVEARLVNIEPGIAAAIDDTGVVADAAGRGAELRIDKQVGSRKTAVGGRVARGGQRIIERRDRINSVVIACVIAFWSEGVTGAKLAKSNVGAPPVPAVK